MGGRVAGKQGFDLIRGADLPHCAQQPGRGIRVVEGGMRSDPPG